jgi:hypothetical protein
LTALSSATVLTSTEDFAVEPKETDQRSAIEAEQLAQEQTRKDAYLAKERALEESQMAAEAKRAEKRAAEEATLLAQEQARKAAFEARERAIAEAEAARKAKETKKRNGDQ